MKMELPPQELHLWTLAYDTGDEALLQASSRLLQKEELERFKQLKFPKTRAERIISQAALRGVLGLYLGCDPAKIRLSRASKGKPWCEEEASISFNLSHSDGMTNIAFARDQEVGVDLERIRAMKDLEALIQKNLKPGEIQQIGDDVNERERNFFRFWTFKESYLKAVGEGMRLSPGKLEFRIRKDGVELFDAPYPFGEESPIIKEFLPEEHYTGTVCYQKNVRIVERSIGGEDIRQWAKEAENGDNEDL
ncbi:MAG: 4'-phosphopantetheinyl transferase superfamily protein [Flavobacteriales bacterium]